MEQVEERPAPHDDEEGDVGETLLAAFESALVVLAEQTHHLPLTVLVAFVLFCGKLRHGWSQDQLRLVPAPRAERQRAIL